MKRYLHFFTLLIQLNYRRSLTQRGDFFSGLFGSLAWSAFSIIAIYILSAKTASVYGWSRQELFILIGVFNIMVGGAFRTFFARNFNRFPQLMSQGDLDGFLLKPIDTQFAISTQHISIYGFIRIFLAIIFTLFMVSQAGIAITFFSLLSFTALSVFGITIIYTMWYLVMTLTVWLPDVNNLDEILYTTDSLTRYPPQVLQAMKIVVFYVFFPFTLVVSTPTKALIHKITASDVVLLIGVAMGLLFISRKFWKFALRYYTSTSG